jgi:pimeloyl-ACP methyl ester carboxylesterase
MPMLKLPDAEIYYEVHGSGFPLLLFAPGGLKSQLAYWRANPADPTKQAPWMDPMKVLSDQFSVVGMDQRNAGQSTGAVRAEDGWHTYAADQLALMDHLGFGKFHTMGGCIGGSFCFKLCEVAPERVTSAVLQNPIGLHENGATWDAAVAGYVETVRGRDPSITEETIRSFGRNMFDHEFVFCVDRDFVRRCRTPLLLQPGTDVPHPAATSAEIAALAPDIEVQTDWRAPIWLDESIRRVRAFLTRHTPTP